MLGGGRRYCLCEQRQMMLHTTERARIRVAWGWLSGLAQLSVATLGPDVSLPGVPGEVAESVVELLVTAPAELHDAQGGRSGESKGLLRRETRQAFGVGEAGPGQSPISASRVAARTTPTRGSDVKIFASGWDSSCSAMRAVSSSIWARTLLSTSTKASVTAPR